MADERIEVEIVLDDGSVKKAFLNMKKAGDDSAKSVEASFSRIVGLVSGVVATVTAAFGLKKIAEAGIESDKAWRSFGVALANAGQFSKETAQSFESFAGTLEKVTGVQDEIIAQGAALLVNVGRLSSDALPRATQAALDLAAGLNKGPEIGFQLLAKAAAGSTDALGKYGIKISESIPKSERFAAVLKLIETNFQGNAAAAANSLEGALKRVEIGFGDIVENLGKLITRSPTAILLTNKLADAFFKMAGAVVEFGRGRDTLKDITLLFLAFADAAVTVFVGTFDSLANGLRVVTRGFQAFGQLFINGVAQIGAAIVKFIITPLVVDFGSALGAVVGTFNQKFAKKIIEKTDELAFELTSKTSAMAQTASANLDFFAADAVDGFQDVINQPLAQPLHEYIQGLADSVIATGEATGQMSSFWDQFKNRTKQNLQETQDKATEFGRTLQNIVARSISATVQSMVRNLAAGKGAFADFGKAILGIIGDAAIQIGEFFLLTGLGLIALLSNPFTAGFTAVAIGIALIAFGALMKSLAGGGGGLDLPGGSFAGDTGGGGGGGSAPTEDQTDEIEREIPQTQVVVNVQGPILDRRETGLAIADIINESFDLNGTRIVTGAV